jgi:hypothetical protein
MPLADNHILLGASYDDLHCLEYNFNNTVAEISMQINTENTQIMGSRTIKLQRRYAIIMGYWNKLLV